MKTNGCKAWFLAARPKTLTGAATPVMMAGAMAVRDVENHADMLLPFCLCLLFAFLMQIDSNLINDYFDFRKGTDREDRLGPERACAQGWVTPGAMMFAIGITTVLAGLVGLPLIYWGGWNLIMVGLLCMMFCFLYTTHLSYFGFGDLLVLVFFGIVPVCCTYYILTNAMTLSCLMAGLACGLATDCLLMVNNYRDCEQDKISGKRTLVVRWGKEFGISSYFALGVLATILGVCSLSLSSNNVLFALPLCIYLFSHFMVWRSMKKLDGRALNGVLGRTAFNIFLFGLLFSILVLIPFC